MPTILNRQAYLRLVEEDLEWLLLQPRTLERDHIAHILRWTIRENADENGARFGCIPSAMMDARDATQARGD